MTLIDAYIETYHSSGEENDDQGGNTVDHSWLPTPIRQVHESALVLVTHWSDSEVSPTESIAQTVLREKLAARKFSLLAAPEPPDPILLLGPNILLTPGNVANLQAQAKAGKTAALGGILAAVLDATRGAMNRVDADYLGFRGGDQARGLILHLDTEQSRYDHYYCVRRALLRAEMRSEPDNFLSFSLVDLPVEERKQALLFALDWGKRRFGGVHLVAIDGIGDLIVDSNDLAASFELVDSLHQLAVFHNCGIVTVLHENPGDGGGKARGHLGSQLERKAESNILIRKETSGISKIWCERGRHCFIPKSEAHLFQWDEDLGLHVSVDPAEIPNREEVTRQEAASLIGQILTTPVTYTHLKQAIMRQTGLSERTAKGRVKQWQSMGLIGKGPDHLYRRLVQGADGAEGVQNQ